MKYIFLDESEELGFKDCSIKYFVIALLVCDEGEIYALRRIIRKIRGKIIKKKLKKYPELKGNNSSDKIRLDILQRFTKTNSEIFVIILEDSRFIEIIKDKIVIKKEIFQKLSGPYRLIKMHHSGTQTSLGLTQIRYTRK